MKKIRKLITIIIVAICVFALGTNAFAATFETEPNDTYEQGNVVPIGDVFVGTISSASDCDYCKFAISQWEATVNVLFLPQFDETADFNFFIWDYTTDTLIVNANSYNPGQYETFSFTAVAGHIYKVAIVADKASDKSYQFVAYTN